MSVTQTENTFVLSRTVIRNSAFSGARFVLTACSLLLITPYILHKLGPAEFGIWALSSVLISYTNLTSFGIGRALERSVAELLALGQEEELLQTIGTAVVLSLSLGGAGCMILLVLREVFVVHIFASIPPELRDSARFVYTGTTIIATINMFFNLFGGILNGAQRIDLRSIVGAITDVISVIGTFVVLQLGYGLQGLVIKNALIALLLGISYIVVVRRIFSFLRLNPFLFSLSRAKALFSFGLNLQVIYLVVIALDPFSKVLLGNALSLEHVTFYEIGAKLPVQLGAFFMSLTLSVFPAAAKMQTNGNNEGNTVRHLYSMTSRYVALFALPLFSLVIVLAGPFINMWVGRGYEISVVTLQVVAVGKLLEALSFPATYVSQGIGEVGVSRAGVVAKGVVNVCLSMALIKFLGYWGVVLALVFGTVVQVGIIYYLFSKRVRVAMVCVLKPLFKQVLPINIILSVGAYLVVSAYVHTFNYFSLILIAVLYLAIYGWVLVKVGWFADQDRQMLDGLLPGWLTKVFTGDRNVTT